MENTLSGQDAKDFMLWLEQIGHFLPPKMPVSDAFKLFQRKLQDEEDLKNEKSCKPK